MSDSKTKPKAMRVSRRDVLRLAAAAAATATSGLSFGQNAVPLPGSKNQTPPNALPIVTKVIPTTNGRVQGLVNNGIHTFNLNSKVVDDPNSEVRKVLQGA